MRYMNIFQRKKNGPPKPNRQNMFFSHTIVGATSVLTAKHPEPDCYPILCGNTIAGICNHKDINFKTYCEIFK